VYAIKQQIFSKTNEGVKIMYARESNRVELDRQGKRTRANADVEQVQLAVRATMWRGMWRVVWLCVACLVLFFAVMITGTLAGWW